MVRNVWVDVIVRPAAEEVHVVDSADESVREQWFAQRDVHASRATLPLEQIARSIVVLTGDPTAAYRLDRQRTLNCCDVTEAAARRLSVRVEGARVVKRPSKLSGTAQASVIAGCVLAFLGGMLVLTKAERPAKPSNENTEFSSRAKARTGIFYPTPAQWATLTVEPVANLPFRLEFTTVGKIAVNEDSATPIFSPYAGRVTELRAKPGDFVRRGQLLFVVEATDTVQGLNDFIAALSARNSARSKLNLTQIVEKRANDLYAGKAVRSRIGNKPKPTWPQPRTICGLPKRPLRRCTTGYVSSAVPKRRSSPFRRTQISPDTPIYSPIEGMSSNARLAPGSLSPAAPPTPPLSSAICRRSG